MEPLLLVEDKNELRAMLRKALERAGYAVDEAPDGTTAIQKVRARRYLMVITDLKMPGASGLDVFRESKQADPTIPMLLLTAFGSVQEALAAMNDGGGMHGAVGICAHCGRTRGYSGDQAADSERGGDGLDRFACGRKRDGERI